MLRNSYENYYTHSKTEQLYTHSKTEQ